MQTFLRSLNTRFVANVGATVGGMSIFGAIVALFKLLDDPTYLVALYGAIIRGQQHLETPTDITTLAQLAAAFFAIFGGIVVALFCSRYGMPETVAAKPPK